MKNNIFRLLFLSVLICNSKTSFGQGLKKDLGVCGKAMSVAMKFDGAHEPILDSALMIEGNEEFCDNGRYEDNSNYIISLYDEDKKLVYDKHVFLNSFLTLEKGDEKKAGKFKATKMITGATSRIVKFPINKEMGKIVSYKIESVLLKETTQMKKISWLLK